MHLIIFGPQINEIILRQLSQILVFIVHFSYSYFLFIFKKCTNNCVCTLNACSAGCGASNSWATSGAYCLQDLNVRI